MTKIWVSPNDHKIIGTLESVPGIGLIDAIDPETGSPNYIGETEMIWDEQKTVERDGRTIYVDEEGDEWTFDQLRQEEE